MVSEADLEEFRQAIEIVSNRLYLALAGLAAIENFMGAWPGIRDILTEEEITILHHAVDQFREGNLDL